jgi:probable phosphoglycerate mutase
MVYRKTTTNRGLFDAEPQAPTPAGVLMAHIDGGSRGNPGPAGYGAYLQEADGSVVAELNDFLGIQTNNFAEYSGLLAALEYAVAHGRRSVKVIGDSELLVKQIKGVYKVRSESILDIYREAKALIAKLEHFEIHHVLRHLNKDADRLANEAMDRGMKGVKVERADAYARSLPGPAPNMSLNTQAQAASAPAPAAVEEVRGFVSGGVVRFLDAKLPDGCYVTIRRSRS